MKKQINLTGYISAKAGVIWSDLKQKDNGDVPGWVLVTVMTAGLVVAIWSIADGQLKSVLQNAIRSVSSP
jgi:hypothetical protein